MRPRTDIRTSLGGAAGTARPQTLEQAIHERRHAPEKFDLNVTGQRFVERHDQRNAVNGPIYRAKLKAEHDKTMLVCSYQKSQEFVMCVTCV